MNIYALTNRSVEIERIAEEFFKDEIIHKATKQPAKHFDINLVENTPLFTPPVVSEKRQKSRNIVKEDDPLLTTLTPFDRFCLVIHSVVGRNKITT